MVDVNTIDTNGSAALETLLLRIAHKPEFKKIDPSLIPLHDITLYDLKGKPFRTYKNGYMDKFPIYEGGRLLQKTQNDWIDYLSRTGDDLISFPLLYGILESLFEHGSSDLRMVYDAMVESPFVTSTKIDYATKRFIHNVGASDYWVMPCHLPCTRNILSDVCSDKEWKDSLQSLFMCKDVEKAMTILDEIGGLTTFIEVPTNKETRSIIPHQAVSLYVGGGLKYVNCYNFPDLEGHTRRVRFLE